ncbi:MAG: hypothetical protein OCU24_01580 [Candidatus Methanospirare jalkutatii]|nr:hypothetical protein [Candidatus Methanospirare jalkutatii]
MMNNQKFIPELHDIGKLVDEKAKEEVKNKIGKAWGGHVFVDFDFQKFGISQPTSPSWWGQYHHKIENNKDINDWDAIPQKFRLSLFLLILADHLASSVSRAVGGRGPKSSQKGIYKLWNKNFYRKMEDKGKQWAAFLKKLFSDIENCHSGEEFLNKYRENLLLTPEDKSIPRNITSLYTHAELVGKIYRVLEKNTKLITESDGTIAIEYNGERVKTIKEAEGGRRTIGNCNNNWNCSNCQDFNSCNIAKGKWQARLIKCWIKFPHSFVRLQDINLLRKREDLVSYIVSHYKDEVIFATSDFMTLFLPLNQNLKEIFKPLLEWGFYVEIEETLADLGILNSILDRKTLQARELNEQPRLNVLNNRGTKVYKKYLMPEMPKEIDLKLPDGKTTHICDICQQRKAIKRSPENKEELVRDWVCEKCLKIREMGEPFKKYGEEWDREGVKVCWFKFSLDQNKLEKWLDNAFGEYVDSFDFKQADILKEEFRALALQADFNKDYKEMLKEFWERLSKKLSDEEKNDIKSPIKEYYELGVFKYSPQLAQKVIETFLDVLDEYFPDCISNENSPISLSLSVANIKYPIREHWRFFEEDSKNFLNVRYHKVFDEKYTKDELKLIIEKAINVEASGSFLHKLAQLEERLQSDIHIAVEIFNNRSRNECHSIYELFSKGIKPSKFLNLYRLLRGEEQ